MEVQLDLTNAADELDKLVEREKMHKQAFRVAFDLLKEFYPVHNTVEWWSNYWAAVVTNDAEHADNPLLRQLIWAITDYLDEEAKRGNGSV